MIGGVIFRGVTAGGVGAFEAVAMAPTDSCILAAELFLLPLSSTSSIFDIASFHLSVESRLRDMSVGLTLRSGVDTVLGSGVGASDSALAGTVGADTFLPPPLALLLLTEDETDDRFLAWFWSAAPATLMMVDPPD